MEPAFWLILAFAVGAIAVHATKGFRFGRSTIPRQGARAELIEGLKNQKMVKLSGVEQGSVSVAATVSQLGKVPAPKAEVGNIGAEIVVIPKEPEDDDEIVFSRSECADFELVDGESTVLVRPNGFVVFVLVINRRVRLSSPPLHLTTLARCSRLTRRCS